MLQRIRNFLIKKSQNGQGIVEYALILAFVVAIATVALTTSGNDSLGAKIKNLFTTTGTTIENTGQNVSGGGGNAQGGGNGGG